MTTRAREEDTTPAPVAKKAKVSEDAKLDNGTVTTFHSTRGFGFISPDVEGMPDVFVHQSAIVGIDDGYRYLTVGEKVAYVAFLDETKNKWKATKVYGPGGTAMKTKSDPRAKSKKGKRGDKRQEQEPEAPQLEPAELLSRVTTQIEYYLSDKNLAQDKWMRNLLAASGVNAISVDNLLRCNKLKALGPDLKVLEEVANASAVMRWTTINDQPAIGRGLSAETAPPLPNYEPPIVALLLDPVDGKTWKDFRAGYMSAFAAPINVYSTAPTPFFIVQAEHKDTIAQAIAAGIQDMDGKQIAGVAAADATQQEELLRFHYDSLGKMAEAKRERDAKGKKGKKGKRRGDRTTDGPVFVGAEEFPNTQQVFDKIKAIMSDYKNSEPLLGEHKSFMHTVFKAHPRAAIKLKYLRQIIIKENEAFDTNTQCFHVVNKDGAEEDISFIKCINNLPKTLQTAEDDDEAF